VLAHPPAPIDLVAVERAGALGEDVGARTERSQLRERPGEVDGRRARGEQRPRRLVQVLAARGRERVPVRSRDSDRGRAADRERSNRLGDLRGGAALELDLLGRKAPLVEEDDPVVLEPDNVVGV
jgi:hypothetical protein